MSFLQVQALCGARDLTEPPQDQTKSYHGSLEFEGTHIYAVGHLQHGIQIYLDMQRRLQLCISICSPFVLTILQLNLFDITGLQVFRLPVSAQHSCKLCFMPHFLIQFWP